MICLIRARVGGGGAEVPAATASEVRAARPMEDPISKRTSHTPDSHLNNHFQQNPLFGMESSLTQSHIGFANAAALAITAPATPGVSVLPLRCKLTM